MSWLQGASDSVDQRYKADREHQGSIYSTKAANASAAKVADLLATAVAIQEEDAAAAGQIGYMARTMIWASLPAYSAETGRSFHGKADGDSTANWTPVPVQTGHLGA